MYARAMKWMLGSLVATIVALPLSVLAAEPDVKLYELTENMKISGGVMLRRQATSALGGFAAPNSPLCVRAVPCAVNATGTDNINTATFKGPAVGDFTVVVNEAGTYDGPEFVVMRGKFHGAIDLSPALGGVPLGPMVGSMNGGGSAARDFTGVFRLPFPCGGAYCYVTSDRSAPGTPTGVVPLEPIEYALGFPTVRLDIWFAGP